MVKALIVLAVFLVGFILLVYWATFPGFGAGDYLLFIVVFVLALTTIPLFVELPEMFRRRRPTTTAAGADA